jgi:hypothetical protein
MEDEGERELIYIISLENLVEKTVEILDIFNDRLLAIEYILKHIDGSHTPNDLTVMTDGVFYVYSRQKGYLYDGEQIKKKYLIHTKVRLESGNIIEVVPRANC